MQNSCGSLPSQVSSSGGGLPGRLDLNRDRGARYLGQILGLRLGLGFRLSLRPDTQDLKRQLVEMVKLTVILASVSTASLPS